MDLRDRIESIRAGRLDETMSALAAAPAATTPGPDHALWRLLSVEHAALASWRPEQEPAFCAQQIHNRAFELGESDVAAAARRLLQSEPWLEQCALLDPDAHALERALSDGDGVRIEPISADGTTTRSGPRGVLELRDVETGALVERVPFVRPKGLAHWLVLDERGRRLSFEQSYPSSSIRDLGTGKTLLRVRRVANLVAVSRDGRWAAIAAASAKGFDGEFTSRYVVGAFDLRTGKTLWTKPCDGMGVLAMSPDGRFVASGGSFHLQLWRLPGGSAVPRAKLPTTFASDLRFSADGQWLAVVNSEGFHLRNLATGKNRHGQLWQGNARAMALASDSAHAAIVSDRELVLVRVASGRVSWSTLAPSPDCHHVAFLGRRGPLAVSTTQGLTHLVRLEDGKSLRTLVAHARPLRASSLTPDGERLVTTDGRTLKVWSLPALLRPSPARGPCLRARSALVTSDGRRAALLTDGSVELLRLDDSLPVRSSARHELPGLGCAALSGDQSSVLCATNEGTVVQLGCDGGHRWERERLAPGPIDALAVSGDGRHLVARLPSQHLLGIWPLAGSDRIEASAEPRYLELGESYRGHVCSLDGRMLAVGYAERIDLIDLAEVSQVRTIQASGACFALSSDGFVVCLPGLHEVAEVRCLATGRQEARGTKPAYRGGVLSPDGHYVVVDQSVGATPNGYLEVEHRAAGSATLRWVGRLRGAIGDEEQPPALLGAVFSGDGRTAVTALPDDGLFAWELPTCRLLGRLVGPDPFVDARLSADGSVVVAWDRQSRVHLLRLHRPTSASGPRAGG